MSFLRVLPVLLLLPMVTLAASDKNFVIQPKFFKVGEIVAPIADMALQTEGKVVVSEKITFPFKANTLYLRHKLGPKEYQWVAGDLAPENFKKLHAFSLAANHLLAYEVATMRFYATNKTKPFQDEADIYFDKEYIYSARVPKLYFMKNGQWQLLKESPLPCVIEINSSIHNLEYSSFQAKLNDQTRSYYPMDPGVYMFSFSAPGFLPMIDIGVAKAGEVLSMRPQLPPMDPTSGAMVVVSISTSQVGATRSLEETEQLYDKFTSEVQTNVSLTDMGVFEKMYPNPKASHTLGLSDNDYDYQEYVKRFKAKKDEARSLWRNSKMSGVNEVNKAFKEKFEILQAPSLTVDNYPSKMELTVDSTAAGLDTNLMLTFGSDHGRIDVAWKGKVNNFNNDSLLNLLILHSTGIRVFLQIQNNKPVWIMKEGLVASRHQYRYERIVFEIDGQQLEGAGAFVLPPYILEQIEVQEWLNPKPVAPVPVVEEKKDVPQKPDTVYFSDAEIYLNSPEMRIPRIFRDKVLGNVALIDSGEFRYQGRIVKMSGFGIQTTEVTQNFFAETMKRADSTKRIVDRSTYKNANIPVHNITWDDAQAFCKMIGGDLPTEAQWEYAGRADNNEGSLWNLEENPDPSKYAIYRQNSYKAGKKSEAYGPQKVSSKKSNPWGIFDMSGNVAEWVKDKYFMLSFWVEESNPTGAMLGSHHILKGGSWKSDEDELNLTERDDEDPRYWSETIGFRCAFPRELIEKLK
ncbi:MAG: SUMF1/EgtB/PvdO family nonheme iron enzyme [Fibrobacteraceae bacterium]|nr:SUMF1/EgtB/PvdO family nonheme iron enzyme [Fibrobacteraceae bacterium]